MPYPNPYLNAVSGAFGLGGRVLNALTGRAVPDLGLGDMIPEQLKSAVEEQKKKKKYGLQASGVDVTKPPGTSGYASQSLFGGGIGGY